MRDWAVGLLLGVVALLGLLWDGAPTWLRVVSMVLLALAFIAPALPFLILLPWHFFALHRGLIARRDEVMSLTLEAETLVLSDGQRVSLDDVASARACRNDNWSESRMLADALTLYSAKGRKLVRVPLDAVGVDALLRELQRRGVLVKDVLVSAPAFLD